MKRTPTFYKYYVTVYVTSYSERLLIRFIILPVHVYMSHFVCAIKRTFPLM